MPVNIPLKVAHRRITLDGVLAVLGVAFVLAYLTAPQFVAGLFWNLALAIEAWGN